MKPAVFHPKARTTLKSFPEEVRREFGKAIFDLQKGKTLAMPLARKMPTVAAGVEELRTKDRRGAYRAFYYARLANAVLVFHAFEKKAAKTPLREIALARKRLEEML